MHESGYVGPDLARAAPLVTQDMMCSVKDGLSVPFFDRPSTRFGAGSR